MIYCYVGLLLLLFLLLCVFVHSPQISLFSTCVSFTCLSHLSTPPLLSFLAQITLALWKDFPDSKNQLLYPQDICDDPRLIVGNISNHQLIQGRLGHKPMVSAFSCLAVQESHWTKVLLLLWCLTQFPPSCLL